MRARARVALAFLAGLATTVAVAAGPAHVDKVILDTLEDLGITEGGVYAGSSLSGLGSTDNALVRTDGTSGDAVQGSLVTVSDTGAVTIPGNLTVSGTFVMGTIVDPSAAGGRLTLSSTVPVSTSDLSNQTTLYYLPYTGNRIATYNGSQWGLQEIPAAGVSIDNTGLSDGINYDVFIFGSTGSLTLFFQNWANDTTRVAPLARKDGVWVMAGSETLRYLGTVRTVDDGGIAKFQDSAAKRFVWNVQNRVKRKLLKRAASSSWNYTINTWRYADGDSGNKVEFVVGLDEAYVAAETHHYSTNSDTFSRYSAPALDWTSGAPPFNDALRSGLFGAVGYGVSLGTYRGQPGAGYHFLAWLELSDPGGTTTWIAGNYGGLVGEVSA